MLPYDFDQAGIINASYAVPSGSLRIRSVRQRVYRGFCTDSGQFASTIATFNDRRASIEDFFGSGSDGSSPGGAALEYLQGFYEIINDPEEQRKKIVDACQPVTG